MESKRCDQTSTVKSPQGCLPPGTSEPPSSLRDRPSHRPGRGPKALITRAAGNREGWEQIKTETAAVASGPGQLAPRRPGWRQGRRWGAQCDGPRHWPAAALPTPEAYRATRVRGSDASLPLGQAISPRLQFRALLEPPCLAPGEGRRILSPPAQGQGLAMSASLSCRRLHPSFLARRDGGQKDRGRAAPVRMDGCGWRGASSV